MQRFKVGANNLKIFNTRVGVKLPMQQAHGVFDKFVISAVHFGECLFVFAAHHVATAAVAVFLVGTVVAIGTALQIRLMDVAGDAQTLAAALNHSAFNAANALGAWLGGVAISAGFGWTSTGYVGAATAVAGLLLYGWARRDARRLRGADAAA